MQKLNERKLCEHEKATQIEGYYLYCPTCGSHLLDGIWISASEMAVILNPKIVERT